MSARRLAEVAGGSHANVIRIESGQQPKPGAEKIAGYAKVLGVSPEWLLTGEGSMHPAPRPETSVDLDDPYPARAAAIVRMRGLVSDDAIARVRADQLLGALDETEWVEELLRADRIARKGLPRNEGQPHATPVAVGQSSSKINPRRGR